MKSEIPTYNVCEPFDMPMSELAFLCDLCELTLHANSDIMQTLIKLFL